MSENHDGYFEVAVVNIMGIPRIWDFYSPPRKRKEESEALCNQYIDHMRDADKAFREKMRISVDEDDLTTYRYRCIQDNIWAEIERAVGNS